MFVSEVSQYITNNTLAFGVALIVHMQSTAWPGFVFSSCSTWLERIIPSAPESSNWQSRKKKKKDIQRKIKLIKNVIGRKR